MKIPRKMVARPCKRPLQSAKGAGTACSLAIQITIRRRIARMGGVVRRKISPLFTVLARKAQELEPWDPPPGSDSSAGTTRRLSGGSARTARSMASSSVPWCTGSQYISSSRLAQPDATGGIHSSLGISSAKVPLGTRISRSSMVEHHRATAA